MEDKIQEAENKFKPISHQDIMNWHTSNGGFAGRPASHAVRMYREVVELCIAAGADEMELRGALEAELEKAQEKGELKYVFDPVRCEEEVADVTFLFNIFNGHTKISPHVATKKKWPIITSRRWIVNKDGVLERDRSNG